MNDLTKEIEDIAVLTEQDLLDQINQPKHPLKQPPGPWEPITEADYGNEYDFTLYEFEDTTVFYPVSRAALQYCYRFLPEDCPRYRGIGFVIENEHIALFVRQARLNNLISLEDYEFAEEDNQLAHQWDNQA